MLNFQVIFQIPVSVLNVERRSRAIVNGTWDLGTKSKTLRRI